MQFTPACLSSLFLYCAVLRSHRHYMMEYHPDDFYSLPPALRRKRWTLCKGGVVPPSTGLGCCQFFAFEPCNNNQRDSTSFPQHRLSPAGCNADVLRASDANDESALDIRRHELLLDEARSLSIIDARSLRVRFFTGRLMTSLYPLARTLGPGPQQRRLVSLPSGGDGSHFPFLTLVAELEPHSSLTQEPLITASNPGKPRLKESRPFRRLRKAKSVQIAYLAAQADSEWFRSLPSKVQQQHFSREEQVRLGGWRSSIIFDAADRALYKLGHQARRSFESISSVPTSAGFSYSTSMASSARAVDSAIGLDDSLYDSFRWLDEDEEIDLSLDNYHTHIAETKKHISTPSSRYSRQRLQRRPQSLRQQTSFRRTLSFSSTTHQNSISSKIPPTSQSSTVPSSLTNITPPAAHKRSFSRPKSSVPILRHISHGSLSSLDSPAQYYQDPEARLKLRVYLASPQKFDEAIEFGFPSLDNKENVRPPRVSLEPRTTI
ncbi:hypothetical protein I7I51_05090, partial [Histoplasma capsulatum]